MIDKISLQRVQDAQDIHDIVERSGVKLVKKGSVYSGLCPFHNEKRPSFIVSPGRGTYHCFSCHVHGDGIKYVQEQEGIGFEDAVRKIAGYYNIEVKDSRNPASEEEKREFAKREEYRGIMSVVQEFFTKSLEENSEEAQKARVYAFGRWGEEYCKELGIGYAPDSWQACIDFCKAKQISVDDLITLGIAKRSEKGSVFAFFRNRITIPIRDRAGNIVAYTARYIGSDPDVAKYFNSPDTPLFKKSSIVFGLNSAAKHAIKSKRFIIVEGAPDTITLQSDSVELYETVAALGTAWSDEQFNLLKKVADRLCFIPDGDPAKEGEHFGPGTKAVMKNGLRAMQLGFDVSVREIPTAEDGSKQDPDSYITDRGKFVKLEDVHFPIWYGTKVLDSCETRTDKAYAINDIASQCLIHVEDVSILEMDIEELCAVYGKKKDWLRAVERAKTFRKDQEKKAEKIERTPETEEMLKFGISVKSGCYGEYKDDEFARWSNFTMKPLFHIIDGENAIRIFKLIGSAGHKADIELRQDELVSLQKFQQRVESIGNFIFKGDMKDLIKLKEWLYSITKSANQISKMGWNEKERLYAFGDGVYHDGEFIRANEMGIVEVDDKAYYLPAFSKMHAGDKEAFQFERSFSASEHGSVSLYDYVKDMAVVFGDNAKVGFAFVLASLFHDVVKKSFKGFPLLNVFGQKGSGKTELGTALMSFFIRQNNPPSLAVTTIASLNDMLSAAENNVVHLDEYKNELDFRKIEMIKGIWGGTGQTKKNMDGDKKVQKTYVRSGIIITGQDMPTRDDALFSRVIHLAYSRTSHTPEEKRAFDNFQQVSSRGVVHLTLELLKFRDLFESSYAEHCHLCKKQLIAALEDEEIDDRVLNNWLIPLAAIHLICTQVELPFSFEDLFKITLDGMKEQQRHLTKNSDIAEFWHLLDAAHMNGKIINKAHFIIAKQTDFKRGQQTYHFDNMKSILYLNYGNVCASLGQRNNGTNVVGRLDQTSLESYLRTHPAFMGTKQCRFRVLQPNGQPDFSMEPNGRGGYTKRFKDVRPMAMAFDYDLLHQAYDINLEVEESIDDEYDKD